MIILTLLIFNPGVCQAAKWPMEAFDAIYTCVEPDGASCLRVLSDGKGRVRSEKTTLTSKVITLSDYPNKAAWNLLETQRKAIKTKIKVDDPGLIDKTNAAQYKAKPLGTRIVMGHQCHGWAYELAGGQNESWVGDELKYLIFYENKSNNGKTIVKLQRYSKTCPPLENFSIPKEYNIITAPKS